MPLLQGFGDLPAASSSALLSTIARAFKTCCHPQSNRHTSFLVHFSFDVDLYTVKMQGRFTTTAMTVRWALLFLDICRWAFLPLVCRPGGAFWTSSTAAVKATFERAYYSNSCILTPPWSSFGGFGGGARLPSISQTLFPTFDESLSPGSLLVRSGCEAFPVLLHYCWCIFTPVINMYFSCCILSRLVVLFYSMVVALFTVSSSSFCGGFAKVFYHPHYYIWNFCFYFRLWKDSSPGI